MPSSQNTTLVRDFQFCTYPASSPLTFHIFLSAFTNSTIPSHFIVFNKPLLASHDHTNPQIKLPLISQHLAPSHQVIHHIFHTLHHISMQCSPNNIAAYLIHKRFIHPQGLLHLSNVQEFSTKSSS